ncbi:uncharacterized protein LOC130669786 [Microplitis mediator]|uniref:uncharacterized protein LOC130669786 n=1 Tax=Microplitis mediator TaxID=375433 RepID=UPI0025550CEA|nr:uncharacterized protein LOC130669786 [Microplitis mediator]
MYQIVIILTVAAVVYGGPVESPTQQPQTADLSSKISTLAPTYEPVPLNNYYYPTYPEYKPEVQPDNTQLIPSLPPRQSSSWTSTIATSLIPIGSFALSVGARAFGHVFQFIALLFVGLTLVTSLCTFTPLCTLTFSGLNLNKREVKQQVSELARAFMTPDNLDAATIFVHRAIQKYYQLQNVGAK